MSISAGGKRAVLVLLGVKLLLHALFVPAFEGPDEPFHLARARAWSQGNIGAAEESVDAETVAAMRSVPCGADLQRAVGCPAFGTTPASFNVLRASSNGAPSGPIGNYQAHQPPLYYALAGGFLALAPAGSPFDQLLWLRLFAVALVLGGLVLCRRALAERAFLGLVLLLFLPGASESLIRAAQEPLVFFWASLWLWAIAKRESTIWAAIALAGAALTKLTAAPLVAFSVAFAGYRRRWHEAMIYAGAGASVLVVQAFRGRAWGGTLEVEALGRDVAPRADSIGEIVVGLAHSAYTFLKTAAWLGGWSVFRPPLLLVALGFGLLLAWFSASRPRQGADPGRAWAHGAACLVAMVGFVAFALGKRELFGVWGAVGGWYFWAWTPWVALLVADLVEARDRRLVRWLLVASIAWGVVLQVAWLWRAGSVYGL